MNTKELLALADYLENVPDVAFNMAEYFEGKNVTYDEDAEYVNLDPLKTKPETCGTAACIAGWEVARKNSGFVRATSAFLEAQRSLDLDRDQASWLFLGAWGCGSLDCMTREDAIIAIRKLAADPAVINTDWRVQNGDPCTD